MEMLKKCSCMVVKKIFLKELPNNHGFGYSSLS